MLMKMFKITKLLYLSLLAVNQVIQSESKTILTLEELNKIKYGSDQFTLATVGDSGSEATAKQVLELSSFDALLHLGDYDYHCLPDNYFFNVLSSKRKYQFMGVLGNHDARRQCPIDVANKFLTNVYDEMTGVLNKYTKCEFSPSKFMWSCVYKNMRIIGLSPSVSGADERASQLDFLKRHLRESKEDWKICTWHFYDKYYHTGKYQNYGNIVSGDGPEDESFYDYCRRHGAMIFNAHDHVYGRTHVMSEFKEPEIDQYDSKTGSSIVQIRDGATFNILNGIGGYEIYIEQKPQKDYPHWQKKFARGDSLENAKRFGGLFCKFNYGGNNRKALCRLLRINSSKKVFDEFYIYRNDHPESVPYSQIDDDFLNEKLTAYKIQNNITDDVTLVEDNSKKNSDKNSYLYEEDNFDNEKGKRNKKGIKNTLIIVGSACSVVAIVACGIIVFKKRKLLEKTSGHHA